MRTTSSLALVGFCIGLVAAPASGLARDVYPGYAMNEYDGQETDLFADNSEGDALAMDDTMAGDEATPPADDEALPGEESYADPAEAAPAYEPTVGRFSMTPVDNGILRLDTATGAVSICKAKGEDWVCTLAADERAAYEEEVGRLLEEKDKLADRIAELEAGSAKSGSTKDETWVPRTFSDVPLSDKEEKELDRVLGLTEKAMRGFIGLAKTLKSGFDDEPTTDMPARKAPQAPEEPESETAPAE